MFEKVLGESYAISSQHTLGEAWTTRSWAVSSVVWHRPGNDPFQTEASASITDSIRIPVNKYSTQP